MLEDLLNQLKMKNEAGGTGGRGDTPTENLDKMLEEAERMVTEMKERDFTPQKTAAEKERDEAQKCTRLTTSFNES